MLLSLNEDSSILLSVIMIPCFIGKCNSDVCLFSNPPIFAHISIFRCRRYVMIPNSGTKTVVETLTVSKVCNDT